MQTIVLTTAAIFGTLAIILGAFGAHLFKKILTEDKLQSFEVGVRYQMYAALALLIVGYNNDFSQTAQQWAFYGIAFGSLLFSVSIYGLSFATYWKVNLRFLGPVTPLGGLLMIIGWIALLVSFY
ncbi:DUF423 domain-containing protein [Sphingobacterium bambusae]|uniref:DUF423 domain-containing protein n=1 Tax=Sphingobacterium bambusae TaxID=662858 RepID=A0ABW6BG54_9SPHI|nr:DUF423 domain-containing protein [Sphingobacterium bambusae]WPL49654.1 DUF423 domain-containing protein [Sphingobacterium bambusae]